MSETGGQKPRRTQSNKFPTPPHLGHLLSDFGQILPFLADDEPVKPGGSRDGRHSKTVGLGNQEAEQWAVQSRLRERAPRPTWPRGPRNAIWESSPTSSSWDSLLKAVTLA